MDPLRCTAGSGLIVMPGGRGTCITERRRRIYSPAGFYHLAEIGAYTFDLQLTDGTIYHYGVPPGLNGYSSLLLSIEDAITTL